MNSPDASTAPPLDDGRMTLFEHLTELRRRMVISAGAIAVGVIIGFVLYNRILSFLVKYYRDVVHDQNKNLIVTDPTQGFTTRFKVATYTGLYLASPVWLYQVWRFITPGLSKREKRYVVPFIISSIALFMFGASVAILTLPQALKFLVDIGGKNVEPFFTPSGYLGLVVLMIVAFSICFEFPVVLVALQLAGVVTSAKLLRGWRVAIVVVVVIAAVATPSQDPYSLFAMAIPMWIFYFAAIGIGKLAKK
jgi:sec-independent protein translocase protein TatC